MKNTWKERGSYIVLCIILLLLLLIAVLSSKEQKDRQTRYKEPVLNQDLYEIHENLGMNNQKGNQTLPTPSLENQKVSEQQAGSNLSNEKKNQPTKTPKATNQGTSMKKPSSSKKTPAPTPTSTVKPKVTETPKPVTTGNTKTASEAIREMKIGWNLGNALDSTNYQKRYLGEEKSVEYYETLWSNPKTTKAMIDEIKKAGFHSIRVPVTYYDHIDESGKIDAHWLERVKEIVQYVLDNDMYCIINVHHDSGFYEGGAWIVADYDKYQENAKNLSNLWTQIATEFKDYDYKLVFEGFNEILDSKRSINWKEGNADTLNVHNLNQVFVDTVRKTGGKNKDRFLAITTYSGATYEHLLKSFKMPTDVVNHKIILALHNYSVTESDIDQVMKNLKRYCIDKKIPVMLDEFGIKQVEMSEEMRTHIASYYVSSAKKLGITCFWWDNGKDTEYQIFNRWNLAWVHPEIKDALISNS